MMIYSQTYYKKKYFKDGFVKIKNFFYKKDLKYVLDNIKKSKKIKNEIRLINPHRQIKIIEKLYKNPELKKIVENFLDAKKIFGLQSELFINPPLKSKGHPPHQDDFFLKTGKNNSLNVWIPLINVKKKNGALSFFINSNKDKIKSRINERSLISDKELNYFSKYKSKTIECEIGDIIIISNNIFHKSLDNISNKKRFVVAFGYIRSGVKFHRGKTAKRRLTKI